MTIEQAIAQAKADMVAYNQAMKSRQEAVRRNAGLRMSNKPTIPVPPKPTRPLAMVCYDANGVYEGRIYRREDCPPGCIIKLEPAL